MSQRVPPSSKIHLKRNSYESVYANTSKYSSDRLLKTDRFYDSRTSFKGLQDSKYQSAFMKRMPTDSKGDTSNIPELDFKLNNMPPMSKALTERRNTEADFTKTYQLGSFQKKNSTDKSKPQILRRFNQQRRKDSQPFVQPNKYYQLENQFAIKKYQQSEQIIIQKSKRVNDLQRLNKFFLKRAQELSHTSQKLNKKNISLKTQLKRFEDLFEWMQRLQQNCQQLENRDENDNINYEIQKQEIYTLTKMS